MSIPPRVDPSVAEDEAFLAHRQEMRDEADRLIADPHVHTPQGPDADSTPPAG